MKIYRIYDHPEHGRQAVKEGFSWPAFFFSFFWALYKRMWIVALGAFLVGAALGFLDEVAALPIGSTWRAMYQMGMAVIVPVILGVHGNRLYSSHLPRKGYELKGWISARSKSEALARTEGSEIWEEPVISRFRIYSPYATGISVLFLSMLLKSAFPAYYIPSPSMLNTLRINDRVFIFRFSFVFSRPKVGDLVAFQVPEDIPNVDPEKPIWIKRIVGVGGDRVSIRTGQLFVNGKPAEDSKFLSTNFYRAGLRNGNSFEETVVPDGQLLLFGDNSWNSYDGRYWGPVPEENLIGKVVFRFWPVSRFGRVEGESFRPPPWINSPESTP